MLVPIPLTTEFLRFPAWNASNSQLKPSQNIDEAALLRQIKPRRLGRKRRKAKAKTEKYVTRPKTRDIYILNFNKNAMADDNIN
jgi:hypothetical protein